MPLSFRIAVKRADSSVFPHTVRPLPQGGPTRRPASRKAESQGKSPASSRRCTCSEYQAQRELNEPWIVILSADHAKLGNSQGKSWGTKLHTVVEIKFEVDEFPLVSRICGVILVLGAVPSCDKGRFP